MTAPDHHRLAFFSKMKSSSIALFIFSLLFSFPIVPGWLFSTSITTNSPHKSYSFLCCPELVTNYIKSYEYHNHSALERTVMFVPPECTRWDVSYRQVATQSSCQGFSKLQQYTRAWRIYDDDDQPERPEALQQHDSGTTTSPTRVESKIIKITSLSPSTVVVAWNVTWIPPSALPWYQMGCIVASITKLQLVYSTYHHLSESISTFSWKAVASVLWDVIRQRQWKVPLACIQGVSRLEFTKHAESDENNVISSSHIRTGLSDDEVQEIATTTTTTTTATPTAPWGGWKLSSITEELIYAQDLQRGRLQNRKCSADLRLFLEQGRQLPVTKNPRQSQKTHLDENKPQATVIHTNPAWNQHQELWFDLVATTIPWSNVPGSGPLDIEPMAEGEGAISVIIFVAMAVVVITTFATVMAPELL